jgi:acyl carrier protein
MEARHRAWPSCWFAATFVARSEPLESSNRFGSMTAAEQHLENQSASEHAVPVQAALTIQRYIAESFVLDEDELLPNTSLIDSGIIDSTGVIEIVSFLEETFGIEVDDVDLVADNLDSVSRLARFVEAKRAAAERG